jgi:DNA-binding PadR family transcriptional regulator
MAIKNKTKYAILGVLCLKPGSGYDIKKFCDKTISHYWSENFGHIYPVLKQLQKECLIEQSEEDSSDKRKPFCITEKGKTEFLKWLMQPPELTPPRSELMLKLSFCNYIPEEHVLGMLAQVRERNTRNLDKYRELEKSYLANEAARKDPAFPYWLAPLRHGILSAETSIRWCDETIENIKRYTSKKKKEN